MSTTTTKRRPSKKATKANPRGAKKRPASELTEDELLNAVADMRAHEPRYPIERLFRKFGYELDPKLR